MALFGKKKKKKKLIIIILVLALLAFGIWYFFWPVDDDYYYDDDYTGRDAYSDDYDSSDSQSSSTSVTAGGSTTREEISSILDTSAVREHQVKLKGNGEDTVTIMMYVNGSNLESDDGEATTDLKEVISGAGVSDKVNILVQTMGTKTWSKDLGISSKQTERFKLDGNGLTKLSSNLGQLDCTISSTLEDFIKWGAANYPADRYILVFWDHGGGAVYGFGYDEWVSDEDASLTLDEIQEALKGAGVYFDFIGMDCCIMSSLETCCAFYDYCDYTILSEDFESGLGWSYTNWIKSIYNNTSIDTETLGTTICDDMVNANVKDSESGDDSILAIIDESMIKVLYQTWRDFAFANESTLTKSNYSKSVRPKNGGRVLPKLARSGFDFFDYYSDSDDEDYTLQDYYEVDIMSAASSISSTESDALKAAVSSSLVHVAYSSGDASYTGIAVSLPYGDSSAYSEMQTIFKNIGFDDEYIAWLEQFVSASGSSDYYDYDDFDSDWSGWDDYDDDYDWSDWDYSDDDSDYGFDDWDYSESFNSWFDSLFGDDYDDYYDDYGPGGNSNDDYYYDDYYYNDDGYDDFGPGDLGGMFEFGGEW